MPAANDTCTAEDIREADIIRAWEALAPEQPEYGDGINFLGLPIEVVRGGWVALDGDQLAAIGRALARGETTTAAELRRLAPIAVHASEEDAVRARGW